MSYRPSAARAAGTPRARMRVAVVTGCGMLTLVAAIASASAREYGAGDVGYLMNLWNTNRERFKGDVTSTDTFSALGTVKSISPSQEGGAFDVVVDVGLTARVACKTGTAAVAEGDTVTVSGRIASAATAVSQMKTSSGGATGPGERARDSLGLQSCAVEKALRPTKN